MLKKKGFTLVELLVVIAIIGILATIVLVNLNTARNKAKNAAMKATLSEARVAGEMWYDDVAGGNGDYDGFCDSTDEGRINDAVTTGQGGTNYDCADSVGAWCIEVTLAGSGAGEWCVDSAGSSGSTADCTSTAPADYTCVTD